MCWTCTKMNYTGIQVAKKDIPIFKIVKGYNTVYISETFGYEYTLNELNPAENLIVEGSYYYAVKRGYHSYSLKGLKVLSENKIAYDAGYDPVELRDFTVVVKGIIPKGSFYLVNEDDVLVSNQIILQKEIDIAKIAKRNKVIKFFKNIFKLTK